MKRDQRGSVIELLRKQIPRTTSGDPGFTRLGLEGFEDEYKDNKPESLLTVFTAEEIVALCNRALYNSEYQREWHRRWERSKSEELKPLKEKVCEMFHLSKWSLATEAQLRQAKQELEREASTKHTK